MQVCEVQVCSAHGGQKRALDPLELELDTCNFYVGGENQTESAAGACS